MASLSAGSVVAMGSLPLTTSRTRGRVGGASVSNGWVEGREGREGRRGGESGRDGSSGVTGKRKASASVSATSLQEAKDKRQKMIVEIAKLKVAIRRKELQSVGAVGEDEGGGGDGDGDVVRRVGMEGREGREDVVTNQVVTL